MIMLPLAIHWNIDPVFFHIGSFAVRYYSLGFLLAFVMGYILVYYMFKREKVRSEYLDSLVVYVPHRCPSGPLPLL